MFLLIESIVQRQKFEIDCICTNIKFFVKNNSRMKTFKFFNFKINLERFQKRLSTIQIFFFLSFFFDFTISFHVKQYLENRKLIQFRFNALFNSRKNRKILRFRLYFVRTYKCFFILRRTRYNKTYFYFYFSSNFNSKNSNSRQHFNFR